MTPETAYSVIIVSWNAAGLLRTCLASVLRDFPPESGEVIVVDNASSDGSPDMVRNEFPSVILLANSENVGFARGNNLALAQSKGRYLFLINSDVEVVPGTYARAVAFMQNRPGVGLAGPVIMGPDGTVQRSCMGFPSLWRTFCSMLALDSLFVKSKLFGGYMMRWFAFDATIPVDVVNGCFWITRREAVDQVGPLDPGFFMYGEDIDWCRRFSNAGWKVFFCHDMTAIHYGGGSSRNAPVRFYVEMCRANQRYWRKHHGWPSAAVYWAFLVFHQFIRITVRGLGWALTFWKAQNGNRHKTKRSMACLLYLLGVLTPAVLSTQPRKWQWLLSSTEA